ncbi:MAG TPA: dihydrolipoamide acetyltransferase family protein [Chlamydiales bacterium]|nr:dihydrolipoamide acetyltransferase family protein [Chlamydiales bacterium]
MKEIKINLPKLGESIVSATVVRWFKKVGDQVALDEPLLEVSTDKVNSEIPSPTVGILKEILAEVDQEVQVGEPLAILTTSTHVTPTVAETAAPTQTTSGTGSEDLLSPAVLRLLKEKAIPLHDIDRIPRTGQGGRLTKKDIEDYAAPKKEEVGTERVKMSSLRKAIADNMVKSFYEAPHASLVTEVDVTNIVKIIQEQKQSFQEKHGVKLSVTAFVARAIAAAVKEFPLLNSSLDVDTIVMKRFVNLGIAVSVDQGVMVPVIRNVQNLSLPDIAKQISELAIKTREHRLDPQDVKEGTITLTNFGMTGVMIGIPIIRHPEVAIVGLGAITKKVMAMPDDSTAIRSVMWMSLTFDHRVLDGIYGCGFLNSLKAHIEGSSV